MEKKTSDVRRETEASSDTVTQIASERPQPSQQVYSSKKRKHGEVRSHPFPDNAQPERDQLKRRKTSQPRTQPSQDPTSVEYQALSRTLPFNRLNASFKEPAQTMRLKMRFGDEAFEIYREYGGFTIDGGGLETANEFFWAIGRHSSPEWVNPRSNSQDWTQLRLLAAREEGKIIFLRATTTALHLPDDVHGLVRKAVYPDTKNIGAAHFRRIYLAGHRFCYSANTHRAARALIELLGIWREVYDAEEELRMSWDRVKAVLGDHFSPPELAVESWDCCDVAKKTKEGLEAVLGKLGV
ncbi:hypothetical protein K402DRAFT_455598 [Aulographum hederae CBS 113979]|uniref:Uncharacterized protein n=1 Tax=Aulographum hederae CBS 113979 TaxID=1176131 RepID=A0A6G1GV88_9PEZI|nr:hypothetical protein K402DRAFT_455598 [Aulographum hederae CBS 113979]